MIFIVERTPVKYEKNISKHSYSIIRFKASKTNWKYGGYLV